MSEYGFSVIPLTVDIRTPQDPQGGVTAASERLGSHAATRGLDTTNATDSALVRLEVR